MDESCSLLCRAIHFLLAGFRYTLRVPPRSHNGFATCWTPAGTMSFKQTDCSSNSSCQHDSLSKPASAATQPHCAAVKNLTNTTARRTRPKKCRATGTECSESNTREGYTQQVRHDWKGVCGHWWSARTRLDNGGRSGRGRRKRLLL